METLTMWADIIIKSDWSAVLMSDQSEIMAKDQVIDYID